ncbi:ATP-binding protein [Streptomyces sp. TRM43335]|uniref:ATP-binding protein n=1 Tax=Streptomyces taklimakanensis TaxID=2569853 RepID=A0A6G2BJY3_9ACTN|nr:ATP-binding protein [Streptomyces taklimakanensis]MTE22202.1 ATP-binding protein [Streptomyces taklimakanensis]
MALLPRSTHLVPTLSAVPVPRSPHRAEFEVPAQRSSVGVARRLLTEWLRRWHCPPDVVDTAQLVVSEFVTNAVVHTVSDRIGCCLLRGEHRLRIEVRDQGTGALGLAARSADVEATNGRGLQLVDTLADAWGDVPVSRAQGRVVWAELRLTDA